MPRRRRHDDVSPLQLERIERQAALLRRELQEAQGWLTPFRAHYDALTQLHGDFRRALNILNGRPTDYVEPHRDHMASGQ